MVGFSSRDGGDDIKKIILLVLLCLPAVAFGQGQKALISDIRRVIGEPDSTTGVTNADIRMWLGQFQREVSLYGVVQNRQIIPLLVADSVRDTFGLATNFLYAISVEKTVQKTRKKQALVPIDPDSVNDAYLRNVPNRYLFERIDSFRVAPAVKSITLANDVFDVVGVLKRDSLRNRLVPLLQRGSDSNYAPAFLPEAYRIRLLVNAGQDTVKLPADFGQLFSISKKIVASAASVSGKRLGLSPIPPESATLAYLKYVPTPFLFERVDTLIMSTARPDTVLKSDVFDVRAAYRKDKTTGQLKPMVRISPDSLQKLAVNPSDYFFTSGQPVPRFVTGQRQAVLDSIYLEVLAIIPRYYIATSYDSMHILNLFPPPAANDSLFITYYPIRQSYSFVGQPFPSLNLYLPPYGESESLYVHARAIIPRYYVYDSTAVLVGGTNNGPSSRTLHVFPPFVSGGATRDTIIVTYAVQLDTIKTAPADAFDTTAIGIGAMEKVLRPAAVFYACAAYYDKMWMADKRDYFDKKWQAIVFGYASKKGRMKLAPSSGQ